jgi:hypothetical protein
MDPGGVHQRDNEWATQSLVGPFRAGPETWVVAPFHGLKPVEEGRHGDLPLLVGSLSYCQPISTVAGKEIWDMLRGRARERENT